MRIRIRNQDFDDQKFEKIYRWKKGDFVAIHLSLGLLKRTSKLREKPSAFKTSDFLPFYIFVCHSCPPGPGYSGPKSMRIHADPDPKHWF
jgi:hypothetical protein